MRLFTAIDIPSGVRDNLRALLDRVRPAAKVSWSAPEKLHITTKFIGEWPENRLDEMKGALERVKGAAEIAISVRGLGWFPNARHPRVLWAGIVADEGLKTLARATEDAVNRIGVPVEDREYSPHLTLARIRERMPLEALHKAIEGRMAEEFGSFTAREFALYLSRGGRYTPLAEFRFA
jgi:RNA 2',3'-cyclic 3'-phosphodiesterase